MRETALRHQNETTGLTIRTGDAGTIVLDAEGSILHRYGTDRHEEQIARFEAEGWRVTEDGARRPAALAGTPPPPTPGADTVRRPQDLARPDNETG
jgi:hypothetical protein